MQTSSACKILQHTGFFNIQGSSVFNPGVYVNEPFRKSFARQFLTLSQARHRTCPDRSLVHERTRFIASGSDGMIPMLAFGTHSALIR